MQKRIVILIILALIFGCSERKADFSSCLLIYLKDGKIVKLTDCSTRISNKDDVREFQYLKNDSLFYYGITILNDTLVKYAGFNNEYLDYIGSCTFLINDKKYKISKFAYDDRNSADEEALVFIEKDLGLIMVNFICQDIITIFKTTNMPDSLSNTMFLPKTKEFWHDPNVRGELRY